MRLDPSRPGSERVPRAGICNGERWEGVGRRWVGGSRKGMGGRE